MNSKKLIIICMTMFLIISITNITLWAQLANTPWPNIHHNSRLDQFTNDAGATQGVVDWSTYFPDNAGKYLLTNLSIGSSGLLFIVTGVIQPISEPFKLRLLDPADGDELHSFSLGSNSDASTSQPMVTTENGQDRIFTGQDGRIRKFKVVSNQLVQETNSPLLFPTSPTDESEVHPFSFTLANDQGARSIGNGRVFFVTFGDGLWAFK